MYAERNIMADAFHAAMDLGKKVQEEFGIVGWGVLLLRDGDGKIKDIEPFANRITTFGDEYYARRGMAGIGTPNAAQPTLANGMKLGTGTTAAAKSGAGAALVTYETGSNNLFDTTHPTLVDETGDTGFSIVYKNTWAAGDVTETALTEAVIVNDAQTDATSAAGNTISRVVFAAKNKTVDDTLAITWSHTFNGA